MKNLKIIGMLIGTALLATACGGGGSGGGNSDFTPPPAAPITKPATGIADTATYAQIADRAGSDDAVRELGILNWTGSSVQNFQDANDAGWTGKGITIRTSDESAGVAEALAPGALVEYDSDGSVTVEKGAEIIDFGIITDKAEVMAAGSAIVWHKFDTLSANQLSELIGDTANDDDTFNLNAALSPAGDLR